MSVELANLSLSDLMDRFGAGGAKPGSGSAAALLGILSAQLLLTVIQLTEKNAKNYSEKLPRLREIEKHLRDRSLPQLYKWFQEDSDLFKAAILLREKRDKERNPEAKRKFAEDALAALRPATDMPIGIAETCARITEFSLEVFDHGYRHARGDSGVAMNVALSSLAGCLSIVQLNLLSFEADKWTAGVQASCDGLQQKLAVLDAEVKDRLTAQISFASKKLELSNEMQSILHFAKSERALSKAKIERLTRRLQRVLWTYRDLIWKTDVPTSYFGVLEPDVVLKKLGFQVDRAPILEGHSGAETAGLIDQRKKLVAISTQFSPQVQNFTIAHELGHALMHNQEVLHRDKPIDGGSPADRRNGEEWQADQFAACFLMPKKLVEKTFLETFGTEKFRITEETAFGLRSTPDGIRQQCGGLRGLTLLLANTIVYHSANFRSLSERFKVSPKAMAIRLEELGLVEF